MQITPAALDAIFYNFNTLYQQAYKRREPWALKVASMVPSTGRENRYAWMKLIPRLRKWIGDRVLNNVAASSYSIVNDDYELTEAVDRNDIMDDNLGVYAPLISMMGDQAARWPDDLLTALIQGGTTNLCYDGQAFFSASHPVGDAAGSTFSNLQASGFALNAANYQTARQTMMLYKGEDGKALLIQPNLLIVPPQLEATARQILNADFIAPAAAIGMNAASQMQTNVLKGSADMQVIQDLGSESDAWYLLDTTKPLMPFIFQLRKAPQFTSLTDPTLENVFMKKKFIYGVDSRGAAGYSLPFLAFRGKA